MLPLFSICMLGGIENFQKCVSRGDNQKNQIYIKGEDK